jgi:arginine-tRNA-protein transferase
MLLDADFEYINQAFEADKVTPAQLDTLLANGWRHFGKYFFRYNLGMVGDDIRPVTPLRIRLSEFSFSKSQRRVLRANADLKVSIEPLAVDAEAEELFHRHKQRFDHYPPDTIYEFLSGNAESSPCETKQICVFDKDKLIAVSYFDVGERAGSGVYAIFDPADAKRGLGIFTMLREVEFSIEHGKEFYYQGYAYEGESFYDYKKRFRCTEIYDWKGRWAPAA